MGETLAPKSGPMGVSGAGFSDSALWLQAGRV
jgi:hypothetical protein